MGLLEDCEPVSWTYEQRILTYQLSPSSLYTVVFKYVLAIV